MPDVDPNADPADGVTPTAERLTRILTRRSLDHRATVDAMILKGQMDATFHSTLAALNAQFAVAFTLRELAHVDPARADVVAQSIWEAWQHGEVGEWLADWAGEYGIPTGTGGAL